MSPPDKPDPNKPNVAPAPPPPPHVAAGLSAQKASGGFDPKGSKLITELLVALAAIAALGALLIFAGGLLASWLTPMIPWKVDKTLGEVSQSQFEMMAADCTNPAAKAYVEELAQPLIEAAGELPFEFTFRVADTEEVNAFALPGGYVTVNWGLIQAAESGEEVAGVIGHEIQHALLRHGTRRILRQMGSSALLSLFLGGSDLHGIAQTAGQLTSLSYDRDQESEADAEGVRLMVDSGMDPRGLASFFARLSKDQVQPPAILSTHPDPGDRAKLVNSAAKGETFRKAPSPEGLSCHLSAEP